MRICVPVPCFYGKMDFCDAVDKIADLGFDAIETYDWTGLDLDAIAAACARRRVEFLSMCTTEFRLTDERYRQAWLDGLKASCAAAARVGSKRLLTQVGNDTGAPRAQLHQNIVTTLKMAVPILEKAGITLMVEPLNILYEHKGYYLWSAVEGFEIIREVDHPQIRLIYDIYHQQVMEGNIINSIVNNLPLIAHLHAAGHPGRIDLQYGESDYRNIWKRVDEAGYTGACGLEYNPVSDPTESLITFRKLYLDK